MGQKRGYSLIEKAGNRLISLKSSLAFGSDEDMAVHGFDKGRKGEMRTFLGH